MEPLQFYVLAVLAVVALGVFVWAVMRLSDACVEIGSQLQSLNDNFLVLFERMDEKGHPGQSE